ncbi:MULTISPECIES: EAL domain-containing protein [unclassified Halomonas]|uniref:bifunctional diguanylate cyclase/phosphodiesterase n=1 Tax=unclassified Halomonas TaxID=2609666 RepID=UPI0007D95B80|nr:MULTISPECIES: EAL domain-containing protein [unclassified Halomonas]MBT2788205.1 EAL domain-containing protein [Halomonas sp. ISL-106]MBT2795954.1 EAL domain-containing protein [Halomonas sp. ISL-104]OAL61231.1 diguanylate cyclase [Halomonas sp. ALS9]
MRFRTRLMLVLLTVVIVSQLATGLAFLRATQNDVIAKGSQRLEVGANVLAQLLDARGEQLANNVAILADDFGFKSAVSTQDTETLYSVLANHGDRAKADIVLLSGLDGHILASSHHAQNSPMPFPQLFERARQEGEAVSVVIAEGQPYEFALLPVRAPNLIGWVGMGFLINEAVTEEINTLTGLDISVVNFLDNREITYLASTHDKQLAQQLMNGRGSELSEGEYTLHSQMTPDAEYLSYASQLYSDAANHTYALLQLSRNELLGAYRSLQWQLLGIIALILLFTVLIAMWSARSMSKPLMELAQAAQRIGRGERFTELPNGTEHSETGLLASTLLAMQEGIAQREATLHHQSRHDLLTDLANRVSAQEDISLLIKRGEPFTLMRLAINNFRDINDTFGYALGDHMLVTLAKRLQHLDADSTAYRLDGDELLLLVKQSRTDFAWRTRLFTTLHQPIDLDKSPITPSLSAGETNYPDHGDGPQLLLRRADIALDMARRHRQPHQRYLEGQDEHHLRQLTLIRDLQDAVSNGELWMAYQPKVDTRSGHVNQCEALMRWRHPSLGFVPPDEFIGLAERSGSIRMLSQWMLANVCAQLHAWQQRGYHLSVAVNLSASDVMDRQLPTYLSSLLERYRLTPARLSIEVTESAVMQDVDAAMATLTELNKLGLRIAIDDYGTGYSSLAQIKRLPVNELKIDKSFVLAIDSQKDDLTIVSSTIDMGHSLGLRLVAEGVENRASAELLSKLGCDYLQGYWIAKPMPADELPTWLDNFTSLSLPHPMSSILKTLQRKP